MSIADISPNSLYLGLFKIIPKISLCIFVIFVIPIFESARKLNPLKIKISKR